MESKYRDCDYESYRPYLSTIISLSRAWLDIKALTTNMELSKQSVVVNE